MPSIRLHPTSPLGPVHLQVADLERSVNFYQRVFGFWIVSQPGLEVRLGSGPTAPLIILTELPGAVPKSEGTTGLYHFAILLPRRRHLAEALRRLIDRGVAIQGAADHLVSEAIYLPDPDGIGIEIYADRAQTEWPQRQGRLQMATLPLDLKGLMAEVGEQEASEGLPLQTRVGHVHLHVADLDRAVRFYEGGLGFEVMAYYGSSAAFLASGGYHHHIGLNTWAGPGAPAPPRNAVGLRYYTLVLADENEGFKLRERADRAGIQYEAQERDLYLRDPFGNALLITSNDRTEAHAFAKRVEAGQRE